MQYCEKCRVSVLGAKQVCPLCQGELTGEPQPQLEPYPPIPTLSYSIGFLLRLISFTAIVSIIVSFTVNLLFPSRVMWCWFVAGGVVCAWITTSVGIIKRKNVLKNISWQLFLLSALAVGWDLATTWRGWSLDYVIPSACMAAMASILIFSKAAKLPAEEYLTYLITDAVYGIVPAVFLLTGLVRVVYPSAICVACSLIYIAAMILFDGKRLKAELQKKFHL